MELGHGGGKPPCRVEMKGEMSVFAIWCGLVVRFLQNCLPQCANFLLLFCVTPGHIFGVVQRMFCTFSYLLVTTHDFFPCSICIISQEKKGNGPGLGLSGYTVVQIHTTSHRPLVVVS